MWLLLAETSRQRDRTDTHAHADTMHTTATLAAITPALTVLHRGPVGRGAAAAGGAAAADISQRWRQLWQRRHCCFR
jgi:hypothetical protein